MKKRFMPLLLLPTLLLSNPFEATLENEISWLQEETFVISASRVKESIKKASASITVIDEETIKKMGAKNIMDVLKTVPGLGISQSNIYVDKITVRGIETWFSEKILILLDGHSLNVDLLNGGATGAYKNLPLELIERVEIIRGPASALYGENAFTALINIITKKAKDINGVEVVVKYGNDDTKNVNLMLANIYENFELTSNINYIDSDGDKAYIERDSVGHSGYTHPTLKSSNGYLSILYKNGFYAKGNYNLTEDGPRYGAAHALNDEDLSKKIAYFLELGYKNSIDSKNDLNIRIYHDYYEADNLWELFSEGFPSPAYTDGMIAKTSYKNKKLGFETLYTIKNKDFIVVSGISYELQKLEDPIYKANYNPSTFAPIITFEDFSDPSTNFISEQERTFWAVYSELLYDIQDNIRATVGMRYDHYSDFGGVFNPRAGITWEINTQNNIKFMYGKAFRAPTFAELYNTNNQTLLGNPDLNPETVKTIEFSIQNTSIDNLQTSLTIFNTDIKDIITTKDGVHVNQGEVDTYGLEVELKYKLNRGSYLLANYTYQNPERDATGEKLENISNHEAYLGVNYRVSKYFNLYMDAIYTGKQTRASDDTREEIQSSVISNATLLISNFTTKDLEMKFSVYNMLDEESYDSNDKKPDGSIPYDYPLASRSYMAEVSYRF